MRFGGTETVWKSHEVVPARHERGFLALTTYPRMADRRRETIAQASSANGVGGIAALRDIGLDRFSGASIYQPAVWVASSQRCDCSSASKCGELHGSRVESGSSVIATLQ
jgi:hypothetical protein